jgi:hypothetical protein
MKEVDWKEKRKIEMFLSGRYCQQSAIYQRGLKVLSFAVANGRQKI